MTKSAQITAIIIDDMKLARETLKADLKEHCQEIKLLAEADSVVSGLKLLKHTTADILFLDIELEDGIGFDIIELLGDSLQSKVIFTTASNDYAIKAFQVSAVDYLMKPIDPELLKEAVLKTTQIATHSADQMGLLKQQLQSKEGTSRIALHTQDKISIVEIQDVVRCESNGNYTTFFLTSKDKVMVTRTLKEFDTILSEHGFVRTHQSHLVNPQLISEYVKTEGGYLIMKDGSRVPVSVRKRPEVLKLLDAL